MKLNLECSAADLYLIAKAFQQAEMQADRNMNASSQPRRRYSSTVSAGMTRKRQDTYEYQKELYGALHDMFLDAIPQQDFKLSVEPEPSES
tara:strand:+ start:1605 stop:1877 length:273 start_codon:yes stop_codon:yes gene_type:complete